MPKAAAIKRVFISSRIGGRKVAFRSCKPPSLFCSISCSFLLSLLLYHSLSFTFSYFSYLVLYFLPSLTLSLALSTFFLLYLPNPLALYLVLSCFISRSFMFFLTLCLALFFLFLLYILL